MDLDPEAQRVDFNALSLYEKLVHKVDVPINISRAPGLC